MARALKSTLTDEEIKKEEIKKEEEKKRLREEKKQAKLLKETQGKSPENNSSSDEKQGKPPDENKSDVPVAKKKIKLLMPIFNESIGLVVDETYSHYNEYAQLIETKAKRMGSFFAEYVE